MKRIILFIMFMILPMVYGDMEVNIGLETDGNITSTIVEEGDVVNTGIVCIGNVCNYDIEDGQVYVEGGQNTTIYHTNHYDKMETNHIDNSADFTMRALVGNLAKYFVQYINGEEVKDDYVQDFFGILDEIFVSHRENVVAINNLEYIGAEFDRLKAENDMIKAYQGIKLDPNILECQTGINRAKRTGTKVVTEHGMMIDLDVFGEECIMLNNNNGTAKSE